MPPMVQIFIAYAHQDAKYLDELRSHLSPLEHDKRAKIWYDGKIEPGAEWEDAIKKHLHGSHIILLLISSDALASEYFYQKEVTQALERHSRGEAKVLPVIIRRCAWEDTRIGHLQALPKHGKPVGSWENRDDAWHNVAESVMRLVKDERLRKLKSEADEVLTQENVDNTSYLEDRDLRWGGILIAALTVFFVLMQVVFWDAEAVQQQTDPEPPFSEDSINSVPPQTPMPSPPANPPVNNDSIRRAVKIENLIGKMVMVEGGDFNMGFMNPRDGRSNHSLFETAHPYRKVQVKRFSIGEKEATQALWRAVMGSDPPSLSNNGCDNCPVESVSWHEVKNFLNKLNQITGKEYRLPTEAEWEFAARGGNKSVNNMYSGSGKGGINLVAHYKENSQKVSFEGRISGRPAEVGLKGANELGLRDMSGNVWEWVEDCWHDNYSGAPTSGSAWLNGTGGNCNYRVIRGGSVESDEMQCRVVFRGRNNASKGDYKIGFRLACSSC